MFIHFTLYKYVFTTQRDNAISYEEKLFVAPHSSVLSEMLKNAKTQEQSSYEHHLNELNEREARMSQRHDEKKRQLERDENEIAANLIKLIESDTNGHNEVDEEEAISEEVNKH